MQASIGNPDDNPNDVVTPNQEDECPTAGIERNDIDDIIESNLFGVDDNNSTAETDGSSLIINPNSNGITNKINNKMVSL